MIIITNNFKEDGIMRYSKQREQILEILRSTKCHPDAEWIYFKVKEIMPKISLGTVYRNLKELVDSGIIDSVETEQKVIRYDADTSPHAHFVCEKCGEVKDIFGDTKVNSAFLDGSKILRQKVIFYGVCRDCIDNSNQKV